MVGNRDNHCCQLQFSIRTHTQRSFCCCYILICDLLIATRMAEGRSKYCHIKDEREFHFHKFPIQQTRGEKKTLNPNKIYVFSSCCLGDSSEIGVNDDGRNACEIYSIFIVKIIDNDKKKKKNPNDIYDISSQINSAQLAMDPLAKQLSQFCHRIHRTDAFK